MEAAWLSLCGFAGAHGGPGALLMSSHVLKETLVLLAVGLNSGLKIFTKPCCKQMCCHLGLSAYVQAELEHDSLGPRIFFLFFLALTLQCLGAPLSSVFGSGSKQYLGNHMVLGGSNSGRL